MTRPSRRQFLASSIAAGAAILAPESMLAIPAKESSRQRSLSSFDGQANKVLRAMTLEEKIGQMTQAEQNALVEVSDIENLFLGSLLSGGSSDPDRKSTRLNSSHIPLS